MTENNMMDRVPPEHERVVVLLESVGRFAMARPCYVTAADIQRMHPIRPNGLLTRSRRPALVWLLAFVVLIGALVIGVRAAGTPHSQVVSPGNRVSNNRATISRVTTRTRTSRVTAT
ncbi:MAG: hypothetical protein WAM97_14085, partial [Acidimicrobiales bacterium]